MTRKSITAIAACACASFRPSSSYSFFRTCQTLTALTVEPTSSRGSTLLNGSFLSAASIAEASATTLPSFTLRLFASLGNQLRHQITRAGTIASDNSLRFFQCLFLRAYAQLDRKSTRLNSSHANISYAV